jgi:hypothetical protein
MADVTIKQAASSFVDACHFIKTGRHLEENASLYKKRISNGLDFNENLPYSVYAAFLAEELSKRVNVKVIDKIIKEDGLAYRKNKKYNLYELYKKTKTK